MADPTTQEFWDDERKRFWAIFGPLAMEILLDGAKAGVALLPLEIQPLINWDTFNANAIKFLREYELKLYDELTLATRKQVMDIIEAWLERGEGMDTLKAELALILGKTKAQTVATTEITRIFAEGNLNSWLSTGFISAKRWETVRDDRVCPLCGPLHGMIVSIEANFTQSAMSLAQTEQLLNLVDGDTQKAINRALSLIKSSGESVPAPPRHFNCRCRLLPVVSIEDFRRSLFAVTGPVEQFEAMAREHLNKLEKIGATLK